MGADGESSCSIAASLDIVGDRWTILILRDVFRGLHRYDEFRRDLDIPRAVLADRLRRLVDGGVLAKRVYQDRPVRHEYRLTEMGRELSPILVGLMQWGDRWLSEDGPPRASCTTHAAPRWRSGSTASPANATSRRPRSRAGRAEPPELPRRLLDFRPVQRSARPTPRVPARIGHRGAHCLMPQMSVDRRGRPHGPPCRSPS